MKKLINLIPILIIIFFNSSKAQEKEHANGITNNLVNATITKSGVYYYTPNFKKIDSLKKDIGEKNFYVLADDNNAYFSEISQKIGNNLIKLKSRNVYFENENFTLNIDSLKNNWGIVEYTKGNKPVIYSFVDYNLLLRDRNENGNQLKNNDLVRIENTSLFVNKKEYKDLIINEMALTTSLEKFDDQSFFLTYEYNGSSTKMKQVYSFTYKNDAIYLTSKEILKYGKEGSLSNKVYLKNYKLTDQLYSDLEDIGSSLNDSFFRNKSSAFTNLYDNFYKKIGILNFTVTNDDKFIKTPVNEAKYIKHIKIIDANKLNDVAYYLEQSGAYKESIFFLNKIIDDNPQRVVAWLNLGDAQWENCKIKDAKKSYLKYIELMKSQKKDLNKIPQRAYERTK
ncbi:tetratricopeptide repeat protein [Flavobacterium sp. JLP]|uniref:tetratricopeptide repeat protein n=1 Tax=Flavobacterium sp. JLP TaxID=2783793 RepID=UPI00188B98E3|nr:tetratricopeptide repeat protein [Flavobacterium sp. JLP]MBF4505745.1 tetratricopeptide repeat protein [Flavobacterium sp. JLP]